MISFRKVSRFCVFVLMNLIAISMGSLICFEGYMKINSCIEVGKLRHFFKGPYAKLDKITIFVNWRLVHDLETNQGLQVIYRVL